MRTSLLRPALPMSATALAICAAIQASSCFSPTQVIVELTTPLNPGQDFDHIEVGVCAVVDDKTTCTKKGWRSWDDHPIIDGDPSSDTLPATLGLYFGDGSPGENARSAKVYVSAKKGGDPIFSATRIVQAHPNETGILDMSISYLCSPDFVDYKEGTDPDPDRMPLQTSCGDDQVCDQGTCRDRPTTCLDEEPPACTPSVNGASLLCGSGRQCRNRECIQVGCPRTYDFKGPLGDARCMDVLTCFANATVAPTVLVDPEHCEFERKDVDYSEMNLALVPVGDNRVGFCQGAECLIPLDDLPTLDLGLPKERQLQLPVKICEAIAGGKIAALLAAPITDVCPQKTPSVIPISKHSTVPACQPTPAADTPGAGAKRSWSWREAPYDVRTWDDRFLHTAAVIHSSTGTGLIVAGGGKFEGSLLEPTSLKLGEPYYNADCFDPATFSTRKGCLYLYVGLVTPRAAHTATTVSTPAGERVLVAGGLARDGGGVFLAKKAELFQPLPLLPGFSEDAAMQTPRAFHTATGSSDGKKVLIAGGVVEANGTEMKTTESVEVYENGAFVPKAPMGEPRLGHTATLLPGRAVLVIGGQSGLKGDAPALKTAECVPLEGTCAGAAKMSEPHAFHAAALLNDGKVLVTGGALNGLAVSKPDAFSSVTATAGIYDCSKASCQWTKAASMHFARALHVATTLKDGRVLVVGGIGATPDGTTILPELYDPINNTWTVLGAPDSAYRALPTVTVLDGDRHVFLGGVDVALPSPGQLAPTLVSVEPLLLFKPVTPFP